MPRYRSRFPQNTPILILDEAASALDTSAEREIQLALAE
jgi:ABC-type transport system involved in Fe-S cluster assembly fused permease/ATPase subunit